MFEEIIKQIEKYDSIVIFGHINPDGDCYGAQVGLREIIKQLYPNKEVYITGTGCPRFFSFLPKMDVVSDEVIAKSLALLVDANDLPRMEDSRIFNCKAWAKIDHHIDTNTFTEGPQVVDIDANSACDILTGMAMELNLKISPRGATALYLGILTDTARFQFVTDYSLTFERVKYLCDCGADIVSINTALAKTDESSLSAKGYILTHYKKTKEGVVYIVYSKEKLNKIKLSANAASNMVNLLGNIEGYPVWCSFAEYKDGRVRVEIRSNGPIIQPCAVRIGGGGHAHASGATIQSLDYDIIEGVINDLNKTVIEWRKEQCGKKN